MRTSHLTTKLPPSCRCSNGLTSRSSFSKYLYGGPPSKYNTYIKLTSINKVVETLNSYHTKIKFTIEIETENKISFLDVLLILSNSLISTKVYRKNTNTDIYINWKSFFIGEQ